MVEYYMNKKIIFFFILFFFIILLLIYTFKKSNETFSNIGQIVIDKQKNQNMKVISKNLPLSVRKKCQLMRRKYPNLKVCIIKKKNYKLNDEQLNELNDTNILDLNDKEDIPNNQIPGYEWKYLDYDNGIAVRCKDQNTFECSSNDGKTCNWGEEDKHNHLEILNKINGKKRATVKCPGWNMSNNKNVCELLKCNLLKSQYKCIDPLLHK